MVTVRDLRFSNASLVTLKPTMMVPFRAVPASSLASGESAGSELSFKPGMPGNSDRGQRQTRLHLERLVVGGSELRLEGVNP